MSEESNTRFIEVNKIVTDKTTGMNTHSEKKIINVDDIVSCRKWHKSSKDRMIKGEISQLMLRNQEIVINRSKDEKVWFPTMLMEESYEDFAYRLSQKVPLTRVE